MIVLDTNIVIYYLQGIEEVVDWIENKIAKGEMLAISTLSVVELLSYKKLDTNQRLVINHLIQTMMVVDVDLVISHEAAKLRNQHTTGTVDSVIAATAKVLSARLITNDRKLQKISGITVQYI